MFTHTAGATSRAFAAGLFLGLASLPVQAIVSLSELAPESSDADYRPGEILPDASQIERARSLQATRVNWNRFGTVHSMIRHGGYLAVGYRGTEVEVARAFIRDNHTLFRLSPASVDSLELVNDGVTPGNPGHAVLLRQRFAGLPAANDGLITVGVVKGKVYYVSSSSAGDQPPPGPAQLGPLEAWLIAAADVNRFVGADQVLAVTDAVEKRGWHMIEVDGFGQTQRARLVAMPIPAGGVRQAWETIVLDVRGSLVMAYVHFVDAENGSILRREDRVNYQAQGNTNTPFSGTMPENGSCGQRHEFTVGNGLRTLAASVAMTNVVNDIYLNMYFVHPVNGPAGVATNDTGTSPEAVTYQPEGGVPEGKYQVEVCMYQGVSPLPPATYDGVFTTSDSSAQPVPFPPRWSWFGSTPALDYTNATDLRTLGCWVNNSECNGYELHNLAARAPWDVNISDGKSTFTTIGNAAKTAESWGSPLTPSSNYAPTSPDRAYVYPFQNLWNVNRCDPASIQPGGVDIDASVTHLFVTHNRLHDWSYFLGFTERNYNLQVSNFGLTASERENDPEIGNVQAGALDGGAPSFQGRDNANQVTLQDGIPGITNQYLFQPIPAAFYAPCSDGDFDTSIVGHEYTHAITNRMIGGPDAGIGGPHAGAMGESWGDLVGIEYQVEYGFLLPGDPLAAGAYATGNPEIAIRDYALNRNPLNLSNFGFDTTGPQVHADGEIWSGVMWRVREELVKKYDATFPSSDLVRQKACADGKYFADACPGNRRWMQLLFDSYLLMSATPSFLDARDAMLAADVARFGGENQFEMWHGFAAFGMGEFAYAVSASDIFPIPSFESPLEEEALITFSATAADEGGVALTSAKIFVGQHATRSRHLADTDPATVVDSSTEAKLRQTQNNSDTFKLPPGTYDLIAEAPGYGQHRYTRTFVAGANTLALPLPTNRASKSNGATVTTSARVAANITAAPNLIDDTENTGALIGDRTTQVDPGLVAGAYASVDLPGSGAYRVYQVNVSTAAGPNNPGRFTGVRKFEIRTCNGICANPLTDFTTVAYTSPNDAFPGGRPRPVQPQLNMRTFTFASVEATHVQLRVLTNQCTGNPEYLGDQDNDPLNNTDCLTYNPAAVGGSTAPAAHQQVRLTELQIFGTPVVVNQAPTANAGPDFEVLEGATGELKGSGLDPEGGVLLYLWAAHPDSAIAVVPDNSTSPGATPDTTFTAPAVDAATPIKFLLTVIDDVGNIGTDDVIVTVLAASIAPVANAGPDQTVDERTPVSLDGTGSVDPDNTTPTFEWSQHPEDPVQVTLTAPGSKTPNFTAPEVAKTTLLRFTLTVRDAGGLSHSDSVAVRVRNVDGETKILGGALSSVTLLFLGLLGLSRRRVN